MLILQTIVDTGMTNSPPCLSLCSRLSGLLAGLLERAALRVSCSRMRLYGHHVFAQDPTALTNPEHSELVAEPIFYAGQLMILTI